MDKVKRALSNYLDWLGEGQLESDLPSHFKSLHRLAQRMKYVTLRRTAGDWIINPTGKRP